MGKHAADKPVAKTKKTKQTDKKAQASKQKTKIRDRAKKNVSKLEVRDETYIGGDG